MIPVSATIEQFDENNFQAICDELGRADEDLLRIIHTHGYPPMWNRPPGFATLIHIILEQQVSLASALAAMNKLTAATGSVTPESLLTLADEDLRACYFSRQKARYARDLAAKIMDGSLNLLQLAMLPDDNVIAELKKVSGIGNWTADIYLMMALRRTDRFPVGDVALLNSLRATKQTDTLITKDNALNIAAGWKPYRTVAAYLLWHAYLAKRLKTTKVDKA